MTRKAVPTASRSAASRKAWRTRKLMASSRKKMMLAYEMDQIELARAPMLAEERAEIMQVLAEQHYIKVKKNYRRLLPCPNFGEKR